MPERFTSRAAGPVAAVAAVLLLAGAASAQRLTGTENGEWRYLGGDAGHTRSSALDQIDGGQLLRPRGRLDLARRQLRPQPRLLQPVHADLRRRRPLHRGVAAAAGGGDRPGHGGDPLDVPRARDRPPSALAPAGLRQGCRLRRGERPRRDLRHQPRLLSVGARRRDRPPPRELGPADPARRLSAVRRPRPHPAPRRGLGALGGPAQPATTPATASPANSAWSPPRPRPSW